MAETEAARSGLERKLAVILAADVAESRGAVADMVVRARRTYRRYRELP